MAALTHPAATLAAIVATGDDDSDQCVHGVHRRHLPLQHPSRIASLNKKTMTNSFQYRGRLPRTSQPSSSLIAASASSSSVMMKEKGLS